MACDQDRDKLAAYLDGEASAAEANSTAQHIRTCSDCAAEVAANVSLGRALKPAASRFIPSPQFREKVQAQVSRETSRRRNWLWPVAAAALAVAAVALVWVGQNTQRDNTFQEVADLHISDLASTNPYDVVSSDRHTVKPWFQGKIPFAFNLPEFAGTEFTLLGGRLVYLDQQPAAQVVVGIRQHKVSVLIVQQTPGLGSAIPFTSGVVVRNSFNVETWKQQGLRFFVIGDADKSAIQLLGRMIEKANP